MRDDSETKRIIQINSKQKQTQGLRKQLWAVGGGGCSRKWQPTPIYLPGKFHRQRSLAGYSPWSHKESDVTELLSMSIGCGEGGGWKGGREG